MPPPINRSNYVLKYSGGVDTGSAFISARWALPVCLFIYPFISSSSPSPLADNSDADQTPSQKSAVSDVCRENVRWNRSGPHKYFPPPAVFVWLSGFNASCAFSARIISPALCGGAKRPTRRRAHETPRQQPPDGESCVARDGRRDVRVSRLTIKHCKNGIFASWILKWAHIYCCSANHMVTEKHMRWKEKLCQLFCFRS